MMVERFEAQHQALRMRRALIGMVGSLAFTVTAWMAWSFGLVYLSAPGFWLVFGPWIVGYAGIIGLLASGSNLRFADPSLTRIQILWASIGALLLYPLAPELAPMCYLALVAVGLFGSFRLQNVQYLGVNLFITLAASAVFAFNFLYWPGIGDTTAAVFGFAGFLVGMAVVTVVGLELNSLRRVLTQRNEQLTLAFDRLREMAIRDELTGIHNRRFLMDVLQQHKAAHDRNPERGFSLCFADLDHFKRVNDLFGHAKGDEVLQCFARIAETAVRESDCVARFGGEEFVLVLVGTPKDSALQVAERIRGQLSELSISDEMPEFRITTSCGITEHLRFESIDTALARADAALFEAKRGGRDRVVIAPDPVPSQADSPDPMAAMPAGGPGRSEP